MTTHRKDPCTSYNFLVTIDGLEVGEFMECSGLESETDVIEYRNGANNEIRNLPGLTRYANISLKRGVTDSIELYNWRRNVIIGNFDRRNGDIILFDKERQEVARWRFREGWPCRMSGPAFNALESKVAIEELVICHEGFERII